MKIWQNLQWLHRPELFRPWVYRIASRACYHHLKRAHQWSDRLDEAVAVEDLPTPANCRIEILSGLDMLLERVSRLASVGALHNFDLGMTFRSRFGQTISVATGLCRSAITLPSSSA